MLSPTTRVLATALLLAAVACEAPASPNGPATYFTLRGEGSASQLRLDGDRLYSQGTELSRVSPTEYRGRWNNLVVDVRSKDGVIEGTIGNERTELHVIKDEHGLGAQGLVGGMLCNFHLAPATFKGVVGQCSYDLARDLTKDPNGPYQGRSACGRKMRYATFELPRTFDTLAPEQAAFYLALATAN